MHHFLYVEFVFAVKIFLKFFGFKFLLGKDDQNYQQIFMENPFFEFYIKIESKNLLFPTTKIDIIKIFAFQRFSYNLFPLK